MEQCLFCKIAAGEVPANIVYNSNDVMAFLDIRPANPGHVLVIPKQHFETLSNIPEELNSVLLQVVKIIAQAQIEVLGAQGVNVLQNNGELAGQAVPHVHIHVIPRFKDDKIIFNWHSIELKPAQFAEIQKRLISKAKELAMTEVKETPKQAEEPEPEQKGKKKLHRIRPRLP
jgi:histidine triad (HIT) family protein